MIKNIFILVTTLLFATTTFAGKEFMAEGTVNAVKSSDEKLNISHGEVKGLMGAMTMDFKVADPAMLDDVEAGSKIKFTLEDNNGNLVVTDLEVTGTSSKTVAADGHDHKH